MKDNILNPWAIDGTGKIISIAQAQKGQSYTCPKCGKPLSYCKSGNGPHARRDHFKHKVDTDCVGYYTPHETESYIHQTAKEGIFTILHSYLENGEPFRVSWNCPTCIKQFGGNLLNGAADVKMENIVDKARSDVAILNEKGEEIVAIEVVYKHDVEQSTLSLYEQRSITLVRLNFCSVEELNDLEQKLHNPDSVNVCLNVKCKDFLSSHLPRSIVPLQNNDGKYAAVAVAIRNPFDDQQQDIWGLPFSEKDRQSAIDFVRHTWPNERFDLELTEQSGQHLAKFVAPSSTPRQAHVSRQINPYGTGVDALMAKKKQQNYMIRKSYAQRWKKSGHKHRR